MDVKELLAQKHANFEIMQNSIEAIILEFEKSNKTTVHIQTGMKPSESVFYREYKMLFNKDEINKEALEVQ